MVASLAVMVLSLLGCLLLVSGIFIYRPDWWRWRKLQDHKQASLVRRLIAFKPVGKLLEFLTGRKGFLFKITAYIIKKTDTVVDIKSFYLYKILCLLLISAIVASVRFTNISKIREVIVAEFSASVADLNMPGLSLGVMDSRPDAAGSNSSTVTSTSTATASTTTTTSASAWATFYAKVKREFKPGFFKRLDFQQKQEIVEKILKPYFRDKDSYQVSLLAAELVKAIEQYEKLKILNLGSWLLILLSYWLPELAIIVKRGLQGSRCKREVIKLENVFELLGSIKGFKTIDILNEMAEASLVYQRQLISCMVQFKTEKQAALDALKNSVRYGKFNRLADIMRIYALTDKSLALDILERNRIEREEQLIITAEEDVDLLDIIAFLSVVPVLYELTELIIRPMVEVINKTFMYIR